MRRARAFLTAKLIDLVRRAHPAITLPGTAFHLYASTDFHPGYGMTWGRWLRLCIRMYRNTRQVFAGLSYKAHLAMTAKLLEIPPSVEGDVVECGCFVGGSTVNLSLACGIAGRRLIVYDSFEGMPPPSTGDRHALPDAEGKFRAELEDVKENVRRHGEIDRCTFVKGWFRDTLPAHDSPIVLCLLDVDHQASLRDCVLNLWPHLTQTGYVFVDEYVYVDYCALFFSERFWREHFDTVPPGLVGAGSGISLGGHFVGPDEEAETNPPASIAYTRKDFRGDWGYFPGEASEPAAAPAVRESG